MTTLFALGAPIGAWMQAIQAAQKTQKTRFHDVPVVREWSPPNSGWLFQQPEDDAIALKRARFNRWASLFSDARGPPPPPPSPVSHSAVVVEWVTVEYA